MPLLNPVYTFIIKHFRLQELGLYIPFESIGFTSAPACMNTLTPSLLWPFLQGSNGPWLISLKIKKNLQKLWIYLIINLCRLFLIYLNFFRKKNIWRENLWSYHLSHKTYYRWQHCNTCRNDLREIIAVYSWRIKD